MSKVRVGILGCGTIANRVYMPAVNRMPGAELVAICDEFAERVEAARSQHGIPQGYTSYDEMLEKAELDLLVNLTHIQAHFDTNLKALRAGAHVYSEKTLTTTVEEASILIDEARSRNLLLGAAAATMLSPANQRVAQLIREGAIGKVLYAHARHAHTGAANNLDFDWPTDPTWFYKPGAGPMLDMGVYPLHTLTGLLGPAKRVTCMSGISMPQRIVRNGPFKGKEIDVEVDDNIIINLDFGNGTFAVMETSYCVLSYKGPTAQFFGSEGVIAINRRGEQPPISLFKDDAKAEVYGWLDVPMRDQQQQWGLASGVEHMIECIDDPSKPLITNAEHARHVIEIMNKAHLASREGRTYDLETTFTPGGTVREPSLTTV